MRERLLGASGADLSRVYFMHECGSLHDVWFGSVFHWDDLTSDQADDVDRDQAGRSRAHAPAVAVPFADLLAAWQLVQRLQENASLGEDGSKMSRVAADVFSVLGVSLSDLLSAWRRERESVS